VTAPSKSDPEVAALALRRDLDALWASGQPVRRGWARRRVDDLTELVTLPARRSGVVEPYLLRLRGDWYPTWPVQVTFVELDGITEPPPDSAWLPKIVDPPFQFALHQSYPYLDGARQLVCFSHSFDYYISGHSPEPSQRWTPGKHTVAATLNRLHEVLGPPHYRGPLAPRVAEAA